MVLVSVFATVTLVLGKITLTPATEKGTKTSVDLPEAVPVEGWQARSTAALKDQDLDKPSYVEGREYQYINGSAVLDVQARYFSGTNGNVPEFIKTYFPSLAKDTMTKDIWEVRAFEQSGSVLLASDTEVLHLSSCINPYGGSTVSARAYKQNRNFQDIRYRLVPWLLGENLKDERCLWTHMSVISTDAQQKKTPEEMSILIENAWSSWYKWWTVQILEMEK
ncbi:hypothetical protein S7335_3636 [Synechococcus sp. PCC 7335]|nr:hypothetical protein S7335_3636 [Synechococcus sp. PCC 7335]